MDELNKRAVRKWVTLAVVFVLVLIGIITFVKAFVAVDTGKVGVVTNYGRVTGRELSEGVAFISPWTEEVTEYDVKTQKVEAPTNAATKDLQDVSAKVVLTYTLNRGKVSEVHQNVGADYQAKEIDPQVQEAFKAVSARYTASELITERAKVKAEVVENLRDRVEQAKRYTIQDVAITDFTFSEAFNQAIEAVQIANQNVAKARQELETTKVEAEKKIEEARGAAEAQRQQQQTLTEELLRKQWIEKWDGKLPTYVGGGDTSFYIPAK